VLDGVWTHLAVADEPENPFTAEQLARFDAALDDLAAAGHRARHVHVSNSAGAPRSPGRAPLDGPHRHRDVRHLSGTRRRSPDRPSSGR
jgi:alanine racemase